MRESGNKGTADMRENADDWIRNCRYPRVGNMKRTRNRRVGARVREGERREREGESWK